MAWLKGSEAQGVMVRLGLCASPLNGRRSPGQLSAVEIRGESYVIVSNGGAERAYPVSSPRGRRPTLLIGPYVVRTEREGTAGRAGFIADEVSNLLPPSAAAVRS